MMNLTGHSLERQARQKKAAGEYPAASLDQEYF